MSSAPLNSENPDLLVSLVTGGSRGIGRATAVRLAAAGRRVIAVARSFQDADRPDRVTRLPCDLSRPDDIVAAVEQIHRDGGLIQTLINNAGQYLEQPFAENSMATVAELIAVNVTGLIEMTHACLPDLRTTAGSIVNVASSIVLRAEVDEAVYAASKSAVKGFSDSLRLELGGSGVRVTTIYPGPVNTWGAGSSEMLLLPGDVAEFVAAVVETDRRIEVGEMSFRAVR